MANRPNQKTESRDVDMTPMIDVTFLLLIFFVLTASFTFHRAIAQSPAQVDEPGRISNVQQDQDFVEIAIDQRGSYLITTDGIQLEAPTVRELRFLLRESNETQSSDRLLITAHEDSLHRQAVAAWNAGVAAGFDSIQLRSTTIDF